MALPADLTFPEDRGNILFQPTGDYKTSTRPKVVTFYDKDLKGCGDKDYRVVSDSINVNKLDDCLPENEITASIKVTFNKLGDRPIQVGIFQDVVDRIIAQMNAIA